VRAKAMLERLPPGPPLVKALADAASDAILVRGDLEEGRVLADRALGLADDLGLRPSPRALGFRAMARCSDGDRGGLQDFRDAIESAVEVGDGQVAGASYNNLAVTLLDYEGPQAALAVLRDGLRFAEARGLQRVALGMSTSVLDPLMFAGEFDEALRSASALAERAESARDEGDLAWVLGVKAIAATMCGRADETARYLERLETLTRRAGRPDFLVLGFGGAALARAALGSTDRAETLLGEVEADGGIDTGDAFAWYLPMLVRTAISIGARGLAERLTERLQPRFPYAEHSRSSADAALIEAGGDPQAAAAMYEAVAARWQDIGVVPEEGLALLGRGRCLLQLPDPGATIAILGGARDLFRACGMRPALEQADGLIASATALGA
jgi:tetratricopeptide (TPR) repeat protein